MSTIGLLQFDILWENPTGNIAAVQKLCKDAKDLDLLILPELWICGFTMNNEAYKTRDAGLQAMQQLSAELGCAVLGGLPQRSGDGQQNCCYLVRSGQEPLVYIKNKAFKFAGEHLKYQQGTEQQCWSCAGFQLSPFVCYDLRFPELARGMVPQANLFSFIANWPSPREHHWRSLLMARAIENQAYVIGVNRIGSDPTGLDYPGASLVISPAGEILLDAGGQEGLFCLELDPQLPGQIRQRFPFLKDI